MGFRTIVDGADFSALRPTSHVPAGLGLTGWFWHGGDLEASSVNWANRSLPAVVAPLSPARPAIQRNYMQTKDTSGWLDSRVAETGSFTLMTIARAPAWPPAGINGPTFIASSVISGAVDGAFLDVVSTGVRGGGAVNLTGTPTLRYATDAADTDGTAVERNRIMNWAFYATTMDVESTVTRMRLYCPTIGYANSPNATTESVQRIISGGSYMIGGNRDSGRGQVADIAFTAMAGRALTEDEIHAVYRQIKGAARRRGIQV